nr:MAG TPA: hypothetical protein [Caudoviricetes sp.]
MPCFQRLSAFFYLGNKSNRAFPYIGNERYIYIYFLFYIWISIVTRVTAPFFVTRQPI